MIRRASAGWKSSGAGGASRGALAVAVAVILARQGEVGLVFRLGFPLCARGSLKGLAWLRSLLKSSRQSLSVRNHVTPAVACAYCNQQHCSAQGKVKHWCRSGVEETYVGLELDSRKDVIRAE